MRSADGHGRAGARWCPVVLAVALLTAGCARPASTDAGTVLTSPESSAASPSADGSTETAAPSAESATPSAETATPSVESATPSIQPSTTEPGTSDTPSTATDTPTAAAVPGCDPATIPTRRAGTLTLATTADPPAPWFTGGEPSDGQGYEAAVAAQVAARLGYQGDRISWITVTEQDGAAGTGAFDAYLGQVIIPDQPDGTVSYSTGYFDDISVVLAKEGSTASRVDSMSQLAALQIGSLGNPAVPDLTVARTFASGATAASGLQSGAVDVVVAPLSVAANSTGVGGLQAFARLPDAPGWQARQIGMVSPAGSGVTDCLSKAIDMVRVDGTLTDLAQQWLPATALPVLADR